MIQELIATITTLIAALTQLLLLQQALPEGKSVGVVEGQYKEALTTVFWVGERANSSNDHIANDASAWDEAWELHFGGYDDPECRDGYHPCDFTPKENPFYVALPYDFVDKEGKVKASAQNIPWYAASIRDDKPLLKNQWVEVTLNDRTCYGQWEDSGPGEYDDFAYVFGDSTEPKNRFGVRAGLDVSPALRDCLAMDGNETTKWRFVEGEEVPEGPWREIITTRDVYWR